MSDIIRYERGPGDIAAPVEIGGDHCIIIGETSVGDRVYPPAEVGGGMRRVAVIRISKCPRSDCIAQVKHYELDGDDGLGVAECLTHEFLWYKKRPE